ncbi:hypothetical protein BGX33_004839 [Mortierella sp. NVP41]|nr:hypothetical protein BGX33_004839 [Mortierella sp. NVP41]
MDLLSQLPVECLQHILQVITDDDNRVSLVTLISLLCVSRYIAMVTLPFLYRDPLRCIALIEGKNKGRQMRAMIRTLLGGIPGSHLSRVLSLAYGLDSTSTELAPAPLDYLRHIHHLSFNMSRFAEYLIKGRHNLAETALAFMEGEEFERMCLVDRMHPACLRTFKNKTDLSMYFYEVTLYRETMWTLAAPNLDQLVSLAIPLSDIHRYQKAIDRLGRLESVHFILDELLHDADGQADEPSKSRRDETMRAMVQFVEDHARLFQDRLRTVNCNGRRLYPLIDQIWPEHVRQQIYRALPPLYKPTSLSNNNWEHFMMNPLATDLGHVQEIIRRSDSQWADIVLVDPHFLQRCRSLRRLNMVSLGKGGFAWAVQQRRRLDGLGQVTGGGGAGGEGGGGGRGGEVLSLEEALAPSPRCDLAPLEILKMREYHPLTDEADNIAIAFSQTLKSLTVAASARLSRQSVIRIGQGWVDLPILTCLSLRSVRTRLVVDPLLLAHCPNVTRVDLTDGTREYRCQDIVPCLSAQLGSLMMLDLDGWPALTFHPATLESTPKLERLLISAGSLQLPSCFIPPVEELDRSYGLQDGTATQDIPAIIRPHWSWDWYLPQLRMLRLIGEFAFRFEFKMLQGCPSLTELSLEMYTGNEGHTRVLSQSDFFMSGTDPDLSTQQPMSKRIRSPALKELNLYGTCVLDDSLLPLLLHGMFPKAKDMSLIGCSGFTLTALIQALKTKARSIHKLHINLPVPTLEEQAKLGLCLRNGRDKSLDYWPFKITFQISEYMVLKDPSSDNTDITDFE